MYVVIEGDLWRHHVGHWQACSVRSMLLESGSNIEVARCLCGLQGHMFKGSHRKMAGVLVVDWRDV